MNQFLNRLAQQTNLTLTENGAVTNRSSLDPCVDYFGLAGAMRDRPDKAVDLFELACKDEPLTAVRTLFYLRDVRGGQGEREVFRACLGWLGANDPQILDKVIEHVPFYGRWDDVIASLPSPQFVGLIRNQLQVDLLSLQLGEPVSLLAKWMPSANASSQRSRHLAVNLAPLLGYTDVQYRKTLSKLRAAIGLLEHDMSSNNWEQIDFSKIPSQAHRRHVKAFQRHTPERYAAYLESVARGEQTINVKTVYPYEIYKMVEQGQNDYANIAWKNLPDYTRGNNAIVMADVSGSMCQGWNAANPIAVSVSLALYFAERNRGVFNGYFMTFSGQPNLVKIHGNSLSEKMQNISNADWGQNTDLLAAFRAILAAGVNSPEDMPKTLYIISDMEFDAATGPAYHYATQMVWDPFYNRYRQAQLRVPNLQPSGSVFAIAKKEYEEVGLELPHVVFWNVQARQAQAPALSSDRNVSLVSGLSPSIFAQTVEGKSARELVDSVVNGERYQRIIL